MSELSASFMFGDLTVTLSRQHADDNRNRPPFAFFPFTPQSAIADNDDKLMLASTRKLPPLLITLLYYQCMILLN